MSGIPSTPLAASYAIWAVWVVSWILAAGWSKPTAAALPALEEVKHRLPTGIGYALILVSARLPPNLGYRFAVTVPLWPVDPVFGWVLVTCQVAGFAFAWWARIHLGELWSSSVTRKAEHRIIDTGPYRLVRHPIYTGMLLSTLALAIEVASPAALLGLGLAIFGFWLKAKLEERFLSRELAGAGYEAYRRRTPMLLPFRVSRR